MTRPAEALSDTALFVPDIWAFTDGEPHAWSSASIKAVTDWRKPFGNDGKRLLTEQCDLVVVPCREVSYHELHTPDFLAAWKRFADDHNLRLKLVYQATINVLQPRDERDEDFQFSIHDMVGPEDGSFASVHFFTKDRYELTGSVSYWLEVISAFGLRCGSFYDPIGQSIDLVNGGKSFTAEDWQRFVRIFADEPERVFGIYDTFWNETLSPVRHVTIVRFETGVIVEDGVARKPRRSNPLATILGNKPAAPQEESPTNVVTGCVFAIEPFDARGRRHRGGR